METQLRSKREGHRAIAVVLAELQQQKLTVQTLKEDLDKLEALTKLLRSQLEIRRQTWGLFLAQKSKRTRNYFRRNLAERGFLGKLEFDHERGRLNIFVNPGNTGSELNIHQ